MFLKKFLPIFVEIGRVVQKTKVPNHKRDTHNRVQFIDLPEISIYQPIRFKLTESLVYYMQVMRSKFDKNRYLIFRVMKFKLFSNLRQFLRKNSIVEIFLMDSNLRTKAKLHTKFYQNLFISLEYQGGMDRGTDRLTGANYHRLY